MYRFSKAPFISDVAASRTFGAPIDLPHVGHVSEAAFVSPPQNWQNDKRQAPLLAGRDLRVQTGYFRSLLHNVIILTGRENQTESLQIIKNNRWMFEISPWSRFAV
jgi:hypothetical protein